MKLRQLFEAPGKTAVAAFGRMNPPTIGHEKLVDAIRSQDGDHYLFLSQTQKPKDNPLPFDIKKEFAKAAFPDVNVGHESVRTPIQMLQMLEKLGYTDVIYIAGSDRVEQFEKLFNDYNGKEYNFNSIKVVSAGERDPDADGAEGMSASKMRAAAAAGDKEAFAQGLPKRIQSEWENVFSAVRSGMGVKELEPETEGLAGSIAGGIVGGIVTKRPSGVYAGARIGSTIHDRMKKKKEKEKEKTKKTVDESQQLNEAFPLLIPALATAVRIGAPAVMRLLTSQGAKTVAKGVARNTGKAAAMTGKTVIKNPGKSLMAVGAYEVWDSVTDAVDWLKSLDIAGLADDVIDALAEVMVRYALPASAVVAALFGGKKLYDYLKQNNEPEEEEIRAALGKEIGVSEEDASGEEEDEFHRKLDKLVHKTFGHSSDEKKKEKKKYKEPAEEGIGSALGGPLGWGAQLALTPSSTAGPRYDEMGPGDILFRALVKNGESEEDAEAAAQEFESMIKDPEVKNAAWGWWEKQTGEKKSSYFNEGDLVLDKTSLVNYMKDQIMQFVEKEDDVDKLSELLVKIAGKTVKDRGGKRYTISDEDVQMAFEAACKNGMYYCSTDKKMKCRKGPKKNRG